MDFAKYSKLIASVVGDLVGVGAGWLAFKVPALATCTGVPETCTVLGLGQAEITAALMIVINAILVERSRANAP